MRSLSIVFLMSIMLAFSATACSEANSSNNDSFTSGENSETPANTDEGESKPEYLTKETFKQKIWDYEKNPQEWVYEGSEPAIIDFYADWCKPCKMVAPILAELSEDYKGKVKIYKIDTMVEKELAAVFQVSSIPAFLYVPAEGQPQMDKGYKDKAAFERIISDVLLVK